jgi:hypothetical protein
MSLDGLEAREQRVAHARDHALRMLEHLRREIDYGYPAHQIRDLRRQTDRAVVTYTKALDDRAAYQRKAR